MNTIPVKKKIIYVITKSNWGGAQRYVFDLATHLPKDEFEVVVALGGTGHSHAAPGALAEKLTAANIRIALIPHFARNISILSEVHAFFELLALFQKERPDIVHLNSSKAGGIGALAARIAAVPKIIFTIHGLPFEEPRPAWQNLLIKLATYATCILADTTITLSERARHTLALLPFWQEKTCAIPLGIEPSPFLERTEARAALAARAQISLPVDTPLIVSIGELHRNKGYDRALTALACMRKETGGAFTYVIIGEGEERNHLEKLIQTLDLAGAVHLLGFVADAATLLRGADLLLILSRKEGIPYVLLEARAACLPILATAVGDIPEVLADSPESILPTCDTHTCAHVIATHLMIPHTLWNIQGLPSQYHLATMLNKTCLVYNITGVALPS